MHLLRNARVRIYPPGYKYQTEYLLTNDDWIKFTDSYWPDEYIRHTLSETGFKKIKCFPHVSKKVRYPITY